MTPHTSLLKMTSSSIDFYEVNHSKTFTLIHMFFRESEHTDENPASTSDSKDKIAPYPQHSLPLFVVLFTVVYLNKVF